MSKDHKWFGTLAIADPQFCENIPDIGQDAIGFFTWIVAWVKMQVEFRIQFLIKVE